MEGGGHRYGPKGQFVGTPYFKLTAASQAERHHRVIRGRFERPNRVRAGVVGAIVFDRIWTVGESLVKKVVPGRGEGGAVVQMYISHLTTHDHCLHMCVWLC
jgi:hypothetical protein